MKGFFVELTMSVMIAVMVVAVMYFWFTGTSAAEPPKLPEAPEVDLICESHEDCQGDQLCLQETTGARFCGCITDEQCDGGFCVNNKCQ